MALNSNFGLPFSVAVSTVFGPMIVHRLDESQGLPVMRSGKPIGMSEIAMLTRVVQRLPGSVTFLDIGSNVGFFTMGLSRAIGKRGKIHSFEGQRQIFYMLAGSVALNSLDNVILHNACVGAELGEIELPKFDYRKPMSFGSVEFGASQIEKLSQDRINDGDPEFVQLVSIDSIKIKEVSIMKVDVEGMELQVFKGASNTIKRDRPIIFAEYLKCGFSPISDYLSDLGYIVCDVGGYNVLAVHRESFNSLGDAQNFISDVTIPPAKVPDGFDGGRYLLLNPDVAEARAEPVRHYLDFGWNEAREY